MLLLILRTYVETNILAVKDVSFWFYVDIK